MSEFIPTAVPAIKEPAATPIENKQELVHKIRELLEIEDVLAKLRREVLQKTKDRQKLSNALIDVMKKNEITSFNTKNSVIEYKVSQTKPLSKRVLNQLLNDFYKDDVESAEGLKKYIHENAPVKTTEKLVRKVKKIVEITEEAQI